MVKWLQMPSPINTIDNAFSKIPKILDLGVIKQNIDMFQLRNPQTFKIVILLIKFLHSLYKRVALLNFK